MSRVVVVGAGVVGLSAAVRLARSGHRVDVVARDLPRESASAAGAGLWRDQRHAEDPRHRAWADEARAELTADAERPGSAVRLLPGHDPALGEETAVVPVVDVAAHLDRLVADLEAHGGSLTRLQLSALPTGADVVVDCTGLGGRHFGADPTISPVREQVALVETASGRPLGCWWHDAGGGGALPSYVVPAGRRVLVGAAVEPGEWDRTAHPEHTAGLLRRGVAAVPELAGARLVGTRVALWPRRPRVRVERVGDVVHCHGLGALGVTLAWGCAGDVERLVGVPTT